MVVAQKLLKTTLIQLLGVAVVKVLFDGYEAHQLSPSHWVGLARATDKTQVALSLQLASSKRCKALLLPSTLILHSEGILYIGSGCITS